MPSESADEAGRRGGLRRRRRLALALLVIVGVAAWGWRSSQRRHHERLLAEARGALDRLRTPSAAPINPAPLVDEAERTLRDYLAAGGNEAASAELLMAVTRSLKSRSLDVSAALAPRSAQSTADLLLAAELLFHAGRWREADSLLDEALGRKEGEAGLRAETLRLAATVRYDLGREDDVLAYCEELERLTPDDARPWIAEAQVYEDRSHWPQALEAYREAVRLKPDQPGLHWKLTEAWVRTGNAREARAALGAIPTTAGSDDTRRLFEARILDLEGRSAESLAIAEELQRKYPDHVDSLLLRGRLLLGLGRLPDARLAFESLVRLDPAMQEAHYSLGQVYARLGEREKAAAEFQIHRQLSDKKLELYRLERQAGREPANRELREQIAELYEKIGLAELAEFWLRASGKVGGKVSEKEDR